MGFYIRKGLNFGPLRINLSRSGLGASFGVKGARIGIGPRGQYVHVGRGGLYYRRYVGRGRTPIALGAPAGSSMLEAGVAAPPAAAHEVAVSDLVDASSGDLLGELERSRRATGWFPLALLVVVLGIVAAVRYDPDWRLAALLPLAVVALVLIARSDAKRCVTELHYHLDSAVAPAYAALCGAFAGLSACQGRWHAPAAGAVPDPRALAGATSAIEPDAIEPRLSLPPRVRCNLEPPTLPAGRRTLYLFPDRILVFEGRAVGAVGWGSARFEVSSARLIEQRAPVADAEVVGQVWLHPNKDGTPDRRYRDNRQLPIVRYGSLGVTSPDGLDEHFLFSRPDAVTAFAGAVADLVKAHPEADRPELGPTHD